MPPKEVVLAALATSAVALLAFGTAHTILITPLVDAEEGESRAALHARLFALPILAGVPIVAVAALGAAWAWTATRGRGRLGSWRFGAAPAAAVAAIVAVNATVTSVPVLIAALPLAALGLPATLGAWAGGRRGAVATGLAFLPVLAAVAFFTAGAADDPTTAREVAFVGAFVTSIVAILVASGLLMERLVTRFEAQTAGAS